MDSRGGYFSKILYVKMKEWRPLGEPRAGRAPLDPPMKKINLITFIIDLITLKKNKPVFTVNKKFLCIFTSYFSMRLMHFMFNCRFLF